MNKINRAVFGIAWQICVALLPCCGKLSSKDSELKITNGTEVALGDAVAKHTLAMLDPTGAQDEPYCSAVLIDKDLALTAAHCINKDKANEPVYLAFGLGVLSKDQVVIRQGIATIHPDFRKQRPMTFYDMALIKFTDNKKIPDHMAPVGIASLNAFASGSSTVIAGYGVLGFNEYTGFIGNSFAKLYKASASIQEFDTTNANLIITKADSLGSACGGDSGGPMFIQTDVNQLLLIGITRGPKEKDPMSLRCQGSGTFTNVAFLRKFTGR